jgi:hypothetical protein
MMQFQTTRASVLRFTGAIVAPPPEAPTSPRSFVYGGRRYALVTREGGSLRLYGPGTRKVADIRRGVGGWVIEGISASYGTLPNAVEQAVLLFGRF